VPGLFKEDGFPATCTAVILRSRASRGVSKDADTGTRGHPSRRGEDTAPQDDGIPYSTLPIFFTAAIRRALSAATNFANSGASI
jgi:hypothetical protein